MAAHEILVVTGASGQLGRLVLAQLQRSAPAAHLVGLVRNPASAQDLTARGIELRTADYGDPAALATALAGADKVLLISSSEVGQRIPQHRNVIQAARAAGVKLLAYTSLLHADTSALALAEEHLATEADIRASGLAYTLLRNGWYTENYAARITAAVNHGVLAGAARHGRISSAARVDYAAAAAAVLASEAASQAGKIYELAGDNGYTLAEFAAEISRQSGKHVAYQDMTEAEYRAVLQGTGLPDAWAELFAECDAKTAMGALHDESHALSRLIGRATTPLSKTIADVLAALPPG